MASATPAPSGGTAKARSRNRSVITPPRPTITTGPKSGSEASPTIASTSGRHRLDDRAAHLRAEPRSIASYAARTASELSRFRATPPTSVLWTTSPERAFKMTGNPTASATAAASSAVAAPRVASAGTPHACSRRAPWSSSSQPPVALVASVEATISLIADRSDSLRARRSSTAGAAAIRRSDRRDPGPPLLAPVMAPPRHLPHPSSQAGCLPRSSRRDRLA